MRILIADDEPVFLKLLQAFFRKLGFDPITCADGDAAWVILTSNDPPPLAVLDWEMPGRSGIDIVRDLKLLRRARPTYCILLTAHTDSAEIAFALSAGAHDYVRKPMHHEEMRSRIRLWRNLIEAEDRALQAHHSIAAIAELWDVAQQHCASDPQLCARMTALLAPQLQRVTA